MGHRRIGLNCDVRPDDWYGEIVRIGWPYVDAVLRAGGIPILLPPVSDELLGEALEGVDGLLLIGGSDYDPALYGRERHPATNVLHPRRMAFDVALARAAIGRGVPTLGICGGIQLLNVALGGTLLQHIPDDVGSPVAHRGEGGDEARHAVEAEPSSRLAAIVGASSFEVNSSHHQAIDGLARGLRVVARASDGVIEAVEGLGAAFLLGVQWHPERMLEREDQLALFRALAEAVVS